MRAKHMGRSLRTDERILHIGGDHKLRLVDARVKIPVIDCGDPFDFPAAKTDLVSLGVEQLHAERLQHANSAVIGRAAANG